MGTALSAALRDAGLTVRGPLDRGAPIGDAMVAIVCVPDGQIAAAASAIPHDRMVAHCSGLTSLDPLARDESFSIHPLLSVTKATRSFAGAACAIEAGTAAARAIAEALARALGMTAVTPLAGSRALYHAAATAAAGGVVSVVLLAERLMARAGVDRAHLAPLVRSAIDNWVTLGEAGLTGPLVRGDEATAARQRAAVAAAAPEELPLWDALGDAMRRVAPSGQTAE